MPQTPYITIADPAIAELSEKKSRFIGQAFPVASEEQARRYLDETRARHHEARHHVYAWVIGEDSSLMRSSDDGEPTGTGGRPVLEIIKRAGLRDIIIIVTRYFGGILLGAGGLTRAYAKAAQLALAAATKIERIPAHKYALTLDYAFLGKIESYLQQNNIMLIEKIFAEKICLICAIDDSMISPFSTHLHDLSHGSLRIDDLAEAIFIDHLL